MKKRPFRSSSPPPSPVTLVAAREVTDPWAPTPHAHFDIRLSPAGMTVGPSAGSRAVVPALVQWSELIGFSADQWVTTADGVTGQILEIVVGGAAGGPQVRRFLVPAPDLVLFFRGVGTWSKLWAADLRNAKAGRGRGSRSTAMGLRSRGAPASRHGAAFAWLTSLVPPGLAERMAGPADADDRSVQRRFGTAVVGLVVLVLVAGIATASFAIAASGGAPTRRAAQPATHHTPVQLGNVI
ncbi:MAG TPA: hypothetical protein VHT49_03470, partial [Acidimicrobiales bacterium]|nr:hypothetical protein [Acidimicrobiales bacterium]